MSDMTAFRESVAASAGMLASDLVAAKALESPDREVATASANRAHLSRVALAGRSSGINTANADGALQFGVAPPPELVERADETSFSLGGGRYLVTVAGTFDPAGTIELADAGGEVFATWTEEGSSILDLRYGTYNFQLSDVSDVTGSVKSTTY